jgi:hypothetical protein
VRGGQKRNESIQKPPDPNVNCKSASSIVPESGPAQAPTGRKEKSVGGGSWRSASVHPAANDQMPN